MNGLMQFIGDDFFCYALNIIVIKKGGYIDNGYLLFFQVNGGNNQFNIFLLAKGHHITG